MSSRAPELLIVVRLFIIDSSPSGGGENKGFLNMKKYLLTGFVLIVSACASTHRPSYIYNEVLVINNSNELLREVTITVPSTGRSFGCGNVAPLGICANRFGKRPYQYNPIQVEWTYGNTQRKSDEFVIEVPAYFSPGNSMRAVFDVSAEGDMSAYFDQDLPTR